MSFPASGYDGFPTATYQELMLDRVKYEAQMRLSAYALDRLRIDVVRDSCRQLVIRLATEGLEDGSRRKVIKKTIVEQPVYETWRHHLVASLPLGSFRRRFAAFFWDIDPEYLGKKKVHEIVVTQRTVFNEAEMVYPKELGPVRFPMMVDHSSHYASHVQPA